MAAAKQSIQFNSSVRSARPLAGHSSQQGQGRWQTMPRDIHNITLALQAAPLHAPVPAPPAAAAGTTPAAG